MGAPRRAPLLRQRKASQAGPNRLGMRHATGTSGLPARPPSFQQPPGDAIMGFKCGIVGLPNVGKSTLFNALTQTAAAEAANYPFCTIEPNVGEVGVPDERLDKLAAIAKSGQIIPTRLTFVDIAGLVRGASKGEGPRQQVPVAHPRGRRRRLRAALLRGRRHHPRREPHRSAGRRRGGRDGADARRHGEPGKAHRRRREEGQDRRQGGQGAVRRDGEGAGPAARGQAGAHGRRHSPRRGRSSWRCSC